MVEPALMFELIVAPVLNKWDQDELMKWKRNREQYIATLDERCMLVGEELSVVQSSVKNSVEGQLHQNIARYILKKPVTEISDEDLITEIGKIFGAMRMDISLTSKSC
ncbi:hypothetical protein AeNC1_017068 [Aphanomyces euteiches]|nr:hypothetical protein AeNC1_017068 [Aphanomyces euteiches]